MAQSQLTYSTYNRKVIIELDLFFSVWFGAHQALLGSIRLLEYDNAQEKVM